MDGDGPGQLEGELQTGAAGSRSRPCSADGGNGNGAVVKSGPTVIVETNHDSNWEIGWTSSEVAEGHNGSHGSIDQADIHPQIACEHHAGGGNKADDRFESRRIVSWGFGCIWASVDGLDGGDRLPTGSELGDGFDGGVEMEGVGEGGQVLNVRGCLHHEVVPEPQQDVAKLGVLSGLAHDLI